MMRASIRRNACARPDVRTVRTLHPLRLKSRIAHEKTPTKLTVSLGPFRHWLVLLRCLRGDKSLSTAYLGARTAAMNRSTAHELKLNLVLTFIIEGGLLPEVDIAHRAA